MYTSGRFASAVLLVALCLLPLVALGAQPAVTDASSSSDFYTLALTEAQKREVQEKYGTGDLLFKDWPRPFGSSKIPDNSDDAIEYAKGLAVYIGVPIAIAVLSLLSGIVYCACKCFCHCCACCQPRKEGYKDTERWRIFWALIVLLVLAMAAAFYGFASNEQLHSALVSDDKGLASVGLRLIDDVSNELGNYKGMVNTILRLLNSSLDIVVDYLGGTAGLETGTRGLTSHVDELAGSISGLTIYIASANRTFACEFCQTAGSQLAQANQEVKDNADSAFESLNDAKESVLEYLVDARHSIGNATEDAASALDDVRNTTLDMRGTVGDITDLIKEYEGHRRDGSIGIFCLPILALVLAGLGGFFRKSLGLTLTWLLSLLILLLIWILLGVHLPLSLVIGDGCLYVDDYQTDFSRVVNNQQAVDVFDSCLTNTSLVTALGYEEELNFTDSIKFPRLGNVDQIANFSLLRDFDRQVQALTVDTFGFNLTETNVLFDTLNAVRDDDAYWARNNITDLDPATYSERDVVEALKEAILIQLHTEFALEVSLAEIRANTSRVLLHADDLKANLTSFINAIDGIEESVQDLFGVTKEFVMSATCGFLGVRYGEIKNGLCRDGVQSISGLSIAFFCIGLCFIPITILAMITAIRIERPLSAVMALEQYDGQVELQPQGQQQLVNPFAGQSPHGGDEVAFAQANADLDGGGGAAAAAAEDGRRDQIPGMVPGHDDDGGFGQDVEAAQDRAG